MTNDWQTPATFAELLGGWVYAVPLMAILTCHELGHYIAARLHGVPASLRLVERGYGDCLAMPLSGRQCLPTPLLRAMHGLEQTRLVQNRWLALRVFAVLERAT